MCEMKISLFGKFCIKADTKLLHKLETRKAEELLCYLLLNHERPHPRESLAEILWEGISPGHAKNYLRKTLWQLQSSVEGLCKPDEQRLLLADADWLQINPIFDLWLDIAVFEEAFDSMQGIRGRELRKEQAQIIQHAVEIYHGDLLEGWYQDWCLYERERLQHLYLALLDKLIDYCEYHQQYENGLIFGEKILRFDRARERTHRRLMRMQYLAGDRTAALRQYKKCVLALEEELDVEPAYRTKLLYQIIRADQMGNLQIEHLEKLEDSKAGEDILITVFSRLNSVQNALSQIQVQIVQDIQAIQRAIKGNQ